VVDRSKRNSPSTYLELLRDHTLRSGTPLVRPRTACAGAVRGRPGCLDRQRRTAVDRHRPSLLAGQPLMGRQRLHADVRRLPATRRPHGRSDRSSPPVHRRPDPVRRRVARGRTGEQRGAADRGSCRAGTGRGAPLSCRPLAPHGDLHRGRRPQQGARRLGRGRRLRGRRRRAARRHAHRVGRLGVGPVRQRPDRHPRRAGRAAAAAREPQRGRAPLRYRGRRLYHRGSVDSRLRAGGCH
jgi:hypothetical protein